MATSSFRLVRRSRAPTEPTGVASERMEVAAAFSRRRPVLEASRLGARQPNAKPEHKMLLRTSRKVTARSCVSESGAEWIHGHQFIAAKENHPRREATIALDPIADR